MAAFFIVVVVVFLFFFNPGIVLVAYSPLCCPGPVRNLKEGDPNVLVDPVVKEIAIKRNATVAQVCHSKCRVLPKY